MTQLKEIEVVLNDPIEVAVKGEHKECSVVLLTAPASKDRKPAGRLKRVCSSILIGSAKDDGAKGAKKAKEKKTAKEDDDGKLKWHELIFLLATAQDDNMDLFEDIYADFFELLEGGCGSINGQPITQYVFDKFSLEDLERLLGEYGVNFLLGFLTQGDGKK